MNQGGGFVGAIRELGGRLIITQTAENHRLIVGLLRTLRSAGMPEGQDILGQVK